MKIVAIEDLQLEENEVRRIFSEFLKPDNDLKYFKNKPDSQSELIDRLSDAEIAIGVNFPISREAISESTNLKMISTSFTGYDHVDIDAATERGVVVTNVPEYATYAVTELVFGFIFSILRKLNKADAVVRTGWTREGLLGKELFGKTLGVIGAGNIGQEVARIGNTFGADVLIYDYAQREDIAEKADAELSRLEDLLKNSDIITIHVPLNEETYGFIGKEEIDLMKEGAILINAARGPIVMREPLMEALKTDKISAGLDVYHEEPLSPDDPLTKTENTAFTPHIGFYTEEALFRRTKTAFENIESFLEGDPKNVVNPTVLDK